MGLGATDQEPEHRSERDAAALPAFRARLRPAGRNNSVVAAGRPTAKSRVLLLDAVVWSPAYPVAHPRRDVLHWYARWLAELPYVDLIRKEAGPGITARSLDGFDGVIVTGSPRDAWTDDPVNLRLCELVGVCRQRSLPFLGVCYGHQILGRALGAPVARHPGGLELGNTPVRLTDAGQRSPLFAGFPAQFDVLSSHADTVLEVPRGSELLVQGAFTEVQGLSEGGVLFGVQFHPEMDPDTLRFLWSTRLASWRPRVKFDLDQTLDALQPTPVAPGIFRNFIALTR
jgi:GMP synthase (glutamine-hydrolysing)